ncbi:unnamed protein product [Arabidopsis halleri]
MGECWVQWEFRSTQFQADLMVIPLRGCDMVLGVQWMETLGPITCDFKKLEMQFRIGHKKEVPTEDLMLVCSLEAKNHSGQADSEGEQLAEILLQQQELNCDRDFILERNKGEVKGCLECVSQSQNVNATFEDFDKADATMNHLLPPIGFVVDDSQSGCRSDIESKDIQQFQIVIEEGNNSYVYQESNGMRLRSHILTQQTKPSKSPKSWKFKFKISKDNKLRYIKFWWEEASTSSKKKLKCGKFWKFHYKNKFICNMKLFTYKKRQKKWPFMGKAEVDKESVEMLRGCTSGQTIGAYGSEIKRRDINNQVWDPGGSVFMNFSFKLKLWIWLDGQIWIKMRLLGS